MVDFVNRNYYAGLMSKTKQIETKRAMAWSQILHLNLLAMAKAARGFFDALR